jgi:hypothetical protein
MKTRYSKPFETLQIKIPYDKGMNPHSGLVDMFEKAGLLTQSGNRLKFVDSHGEEHLHYRKEWKEDKLNMIMEDFPNHKKSTKDQQLEETVENE